MLTCPRATSASSKTNKQDKIEALPLFNSHLLWYVIVVIIQSSMFVLGVYIHVNNHMLFFLVQEASQLLTILQSLQPPLKLDGKTIGVDYAKSARKWVTAHWYWLSVSLAFWIEYIKYVLCGQCFLIPRINFLQLPLTVSPMLRVGSLFKYERSK